MRVVLVVENWDNWKGVLCWGDTLPNYTFNPYAANAWNIKSGSTC